MKPESKIKAMVKEYLDSLGSECKYFMPQAGIYGQKGVSDFIVCYRGHSIAIETKKECKTLEQAEKLLAPLQRKFLDDWTAAGGMRFLIYNEESLNRLKHRFMFYV